jgi:hypothetical protein
MAARTVKKKKAEPGGTAKFREETSKETRICAQASILQRNIDCGWTGRLLASSAPRAEFREKRPHPAIKSGVFRLCPQARLDMKLVFPLRSPMAAANASARGQRAAILASPLSELSGFCLVVDCLAPDCGGERTFSVSDLAGFYGASRTVGDVLRRMRCSGGCGGRAACAVAGGGGEGVAFGHRAGEVLHEQR